MKKKASLGELKKYCALRSPRKFIFCTENQSGVLSEVSCKFHLSFPTMMVTESPNQICLKADSGTICLTKVCFVEINTEKSILGDVITVFCGNVGAQRPDTAYTLIAA